MRDVQIDQSCRVEEIRHGVERPPQKSEAVVSRGAVGGALKEVRPDRVFVLGLGVRSASQQERRKAPIPISVWKRHRKELDVRRSAKRRELSDHSEGRLSADTVGGNGICGMSHGLDLDLRPQLPRE